jgi:hypothetical protein
MPTPVQTKSATAAAASLAITLTTPVVSGHIIFVFLGATALANVTTVTVTDTLGNVYTKLVDQLVGNVNGAQCWYIASSAAGACTITISVTTANSIQGIAAEYPAIGASDVNNSGRASRGVSNVATGNTVTTANDLVIAFGYDVGGILV